jgi:hypothetical protein
MLGSSSERINRVHARLSQCCFYKATPISADLDLSVLIGGSEYKEHQLGYASWIRKAVRLLGPIICVFAAPDVSNNNPVVGNGSSRAIQLGFKLSF